ncbi:nesprin-2a isoform X2 [Salminus brasiliensis]|uniref:nesprin-2a isoform X2 n=1 Tax=Salminus brasiliensis TaxID=930266 RepID=UPI003B8336AB
MASEAEPEAALGDARAFPLDIDDVHMLLQVEQEQVQKRTFTNWINAQLSKRSSPSLVQDLFADLSDGTRLLDLLEVMSGQRLKREKGHGVFQQRGNVETALNFLKNKSIKLVNINIPDIIEGKPCIILGLIWTIILHCHIEELASTLSFGSRSSSLESLSSQDSAPGTPVRGSPVPRRMSPLHARFCLSAKKALLLWVRDQCRNVGCSVSVKNFKSSWRNGVAFLAILCSLRPDLVDLSLTETRSNLQNLEEAFRIAQQELGIPRLLEPEDIDITNPDEKSIMTYVAQFLQYSNDLPSAEDDLEASHSQKVRENTCWLQQAYKEVLDIWSSTEGEGYAERYQTFQTFVESFYEQRRPVIPLLSAMKRSSKLSEDQLALKKAWDLMEKRLQQYRTELDEALPAPLHTLGKWLQAMEVVLSEERGNSDDHARSSRDARDKQEKLRVLLEDMSGHLDTLHQFRNTEDGGGSRVPADKLDEMKRRFTNARVTAKYHGIKLEYREQWHHVQELLGCLKSKLNSWRAPYTSQEAVHSLMQDWHDSINTQGMVSKLKAAVHKLKQTASTYTSKAALAEDSGAVSRQVKEAEKEAETSAEAAFAVKDTMSRVLAEWESYRDCSHSLQAFLEGQTQTAGKEQASWNLSEWSTCQARLNKAGNFLTEVTDSSTSYSVADELSRLNIKWADFIKRTKFTVDPQQSSGIAPCAHNAQMLLQEAGWMLREAVEVSSGALRTYRTKLQMVTKKMTELDLGSLSPSPEFSEEALQKLKNTLPEVRETLNRVEQACKRLQKGASLLEGRLAELGHWSTEAIEVCQQLREWQHRHQTPHPRGKTLISRGLQLEGQVMTEGQDLQSLLENVQKSSSLPYLSISALQDRVKHTVKHCQEIIKKLNHMGVKCEGMTEGGKPPPKIIVRAYTTPEAQTGTFQEHEAQVCRVHLESLTQPQSQQEVQRVQLKAKPGPQPHELSLADPQEQKSILRNVDVLLKQHQTLPSSPLGKESQTETESEVQVLTLGHIETTISLETPQQSPGSLFSANSSQNMYSYQPMTSQQQHSGAQSEAKPQTATTTLHLHHGLLDKAQHFPQSLETSHAHVKTSPQAQAKLHMQGDTPTHTQLGILPCTPKHAQAQPKAQSSSTRQKQRGPGKTSGSAHVPGQTEVYSKAQAMARSRMEKAKQRLHEHIEEVITIFSNKVISEEQARRKKGTLRQLKPAVLEEFLEAVEGVGAFCSEAQLRDMEHLSLSVRAQWEAVHSAIESFLPDLWREVRRREPIIVAALKSEIDTNIETPACVPDQVCSEQACSLIVEPRGRLEALQGLSDTLKTSASSCLATTHLRESGGKLETVQYHVNPTSNRVLPQHSRGEQTQDSTLLRETRLPADQSLSQAHLQGVVQANSVGTKQTPNRTVIHISQVQEENTTPQETHSNHSAAHSALRQQLQMNSEHLKTGFPTSSSLSHASLNAHLQEAQTLKQQTEALWSELDLQSSSHMDDGCNVESERILLIQQWRGQQITFQARMKSLESALELLEPVEVNIKLISDQLNQLTQKPMDITGFVLTESRALHGGIKLVGEHIQRELKLLADSESKAADSAGLTEDELLTHLPLQHTIQNCTDHLEQLKNNLGKAQSALDALEHLLPILHQLHVELPTTSETSALPAASIQQRLQEAKEKAEDLDHMLEDAGVCVSLDTRIGSCQDIVCTLFKRAAGITAGRAEKGAQGKEEEEQRERMLDRKKKALQATLRELQGMLERQGLKEPTLPALQHRLRCLTDIESKLTALHSDIQSVQDVSQTHRHDDLNELEAQWKETHTAVTESREECLSLTELLKRFQNCRSHLGDTLQRAEQTISEQASYMGKDNLQRLLTRVNDIKLELSAVGDKVEEFRAVCRQLQSQIRKIPDCPEAPFESEADALMDRWLDVSERIDCRLDNLQVGLSLWDKLLLLAREVDDWTTCKLIALAQSQPFQTVQEVTSMQEEVRTQEDNVARFHRRSAEIQELLQSKEHPLELQVIGSQLMKRIGEVKELFSETSDVFRELVAAKAQVAASMTECMSSVQAIKDALSALTASGSPQFFQDIQGLFEQLQAKAEQGHAVLHNLALLSNVASPESLHTLTEDGARLQESIFAAKKMIILRREQAEHLRKPQVKDAEDKGIEDLNFKVSTVQRTQDALPLQPNFIDPQHPQGEAALSCHKTEESPKESSAHNDFLEEMQDFTHKAESTGTLTSGILVDVLDVNIEKKKANIEANLTGLPNQLQQVENRLQQLQEQKAGLVVLFPWSGLVEKQEALEKATGLLDTAKALNSEITTQRDQIEEHAPIIENPSSSYDGLENSVSSLIVQLNDMCKGLNESILKEQCCSLRLKQCGEILDHLEKRMQEQVLVCPHTQDQTFEVETLQALLLALGQQDKQLQDVEALAAALLKSCTTEGQTALSLSVQSLLTKRVMLRESIHKQLSCLENQKTGEKMFEVAAGSIKEDMEDTQIREETHVTLLSKQDQKPSSVTKDMVDITTPLQQCYEAPKPDLTTVLDTVFSTPVLLSVDSTSVSPNIKITKTEVRNLEFEETTQSTADFTASQREDESSTDEPALKKVGRLILDTGTHAKFDDEITFSQENENFQKESEISHGSASEICRPETDVVVSDSNKSGFRSPESAKVYTIVLDVDQPILRPDEHVESPETVNAHEFCSRNVPFYPDFAKPMDSKSEKPECVRTWSPMQPLDRFEETQFALPEAVQPGHAENECTQQHQTPVSTKSSTEETEVQESSQWATDNHQAAAISVTNIVEAFVLQNATVGETCQHNGKFVSYQQKSTSIMTQEKTNELDTNQVKAHNSDCSEPSTLALNKKNYEDDKKMEPHSSKQMSAASSLYDPTTNTRHPHTTATACTVSAESSHKDTAEPQDVTTDTKQVEAMDTTQDDVLNSLQMVETDGIFGTQATAAGMGHMGTSHTSVIENDSLEIKSIDIEHVSQKQTPDSAAIKSHKLESTTTLPSQLFSTPAKTCLSDQSEDSHSIIYIKLEEMSSSKSDVSEGEDALSGVPNESSMERVRHIQDQPTGPSGWTTLLDITTAVQPLIDTSSVSTDSQSRQAPWNLEQSLTDTEKQLEKTVLRVLRCRYQPAQLNIELMIQQLQEAENCRQCVVDQVAALSQCVGNGHSKHSPAVEGRWSAALLDASATVQVKEAQLHQITQYYEQIQALQDTLQELETELDSLSLNSLRSSVIQAEKLHAFLKTMEQKKGLLEELLQTCSQVSTHLGETEGPVVCLLQVKTLQEKWQTLEETADLSLRHADICTSEASILLKDTKVLLGELSSLQTTFPSQSPQTHVQCQNTIQRIMALSDFVEMNERYLYLCELCQGLFQCSLGQREREELEQALENVKSQLHHTQEKLGTHDTIPSDHSLTEIIRDYFTWAKQIENKVTRRKKLSLFPEEANQQVNNMKKLQADISSRRSKFSSVVKKLREETARLNKGDSSFIFSALEALENLYSMISEKSDSSSAELYKMFYARQRLESQITESSTWVSSLLEKESCKCAAVELGTTIADLKVHHQRHKATLKEAERRMVTIQTILNESKDMIQGLTVAESFHLIDKLTTLRNEIIGIVRCKRASCWELEELLHAQESSTEEFAAIQKSLRQMTTDFEKQRYPVTQESLSAFVPVRYMLMEHQSQVQEAQHCQEHRRKDLLCTILALQGRARLLDQKSKEHEKYLSSKKHLDTYREAIRKTVSQVSDMSIEISKRLRLGQSLLVELPLLMMSCQEAADQLEALSSDLYPSQLNSERQKIQSLFESIAAWERIVSNEVKSLEHSLVEHLSGPMELSALTGHFMKAKHQLKQISCLEPTDQSIVKALRKYWAIQSSVDSGLRMLEGCKDCTSVESYGKATDMGRRTLEECKMHMEKLIQAKEALKDYLWAVQEAIGFLQQVEFRLLIPSASFKDYMEELRHTQQTLASLSDGFQAHMDEIRARLPIQSCFSSSLTEKLQIQVISHLLVHDAILEAHIQLKLKTLQRCLKEQSSRSKQHDEMNQLLRNFDRTLSESFNHKPAILGECKDQLRDIKALQEELKSMSRRLEEMRESCLAPGCNAAVDQTLGNLWRHWAMLQRRLEALKSRVTHTKTEWKEIWLRINKSREVLERVQGVLTDFSKVKRSLGNLKWILAQTEQLQDALDQEHLILVSLQRCGTNLQELNKPTEMSQELQSLQSRCRSLREQSSIVRREVLSEIQEWGRLQEELKAVQQSVLSLLCVLQNQSDPSHLQEIKVELGSQYARLQDIMNRVKKSSKEPPQEIQTLHDEVTLCLQNVKEKVRQAMESTNPLHRMSEQLGEVTVGLNCVQALLQKKSSTVQEAENTLKRVWDELDQWHSRIAELESEVQELAEDQPERAHMLMDELTKPLQFYQDVAKQAEQRTAFISRIPPCLQEYEDILHSSTQWLAEAQTWLDTPHTYTTAKCLHSHANSLQVVLDESEGIRGALEAFGPALEEISAVCDTSSQEQNLMQVQTRVVHMQRHALEPLTQLQHAAAEMDAIEAEVKTMEKNLTKIRTILSTVDTEDIPLEEHLHNRQVILDNLQVMNRTIDEIERCRAGLGLPAGAEHSLSAFQKAQQLQQPILDLQQLTEDQTAELKAAIGHSIDVISPSEQATASSLALQYPGNLMIPVERPYNDEDDDYEDGSSHSSSSETLTCSVPEDPDEIVLDDEHSEMEATAVVKLSFTKESSPEDEKSSVPLKTETKPGNAVSPSQLTKCLPDNTVAKDTASVPTISSQSFEKLIPVRLAPPSETSYKETEEDIRQAETTKEPEKLTVNNLVKSEETETKTCVSRSSQKDKDKEANNMETLSDIPKKLTDQLEGSTSNSTEKEAVACTAISKVPQTASKASEPEETSVPTLVLSHSGTDTGPQDDTALQVQGELREQRDLIEAIARHGSISDLELEEQTQTNARSSAKGICVSGQLVEMATVRDNWTQLLLRLQTLLDSDTAQDRIASEVTGPSIMQEILGYTERLRHIRQKACAAAADERETVQSELCDTLTGLSHSLSTITHMLHTPSEDSREAYQLHLLNLQSISAQMTTVSSEISGMDSEITEAFGLEASDVSSCLQCLNSYISSAQRALSSQDELLSRQLGHTFQLQTGEQLLESPVSVLKTKETQQDETRSHIQDRSSKQTGQGNVWSSMREQQGSVRENAALQRCCHSLLQVLRALLDLGSERVRNCQNPKSHSCSELQNLFRGHKKYFQELKSYYVMILHLSEKLPEGALQGQGDVGRLVTELLLKAHEQGAHMQQNIQEWSQYEEMKKSLCKKLEELHAAMPSESLDMENEPQLEERLQAYQWLRGLLEDSKPQLGLLQDLGRTLQSQTSCWERVAHAGPGSGLQANWLAFSRRLEYEIQCTNEKRVNYDRFQSISADLEAWMGTARSQVQMWDNLCDSKLLLPKLMDFSKELDIRSVQKADAVKAGTRVLTLSDTEAPELRKHLTQLEQNWTELINTLPSVQHKLEQLLAGLDRGEVMAELTSWLEHMGGRLEEESAREYLVQDASELTTLVEWLKACKAEVTSRQPCIDFFRQSVEEVSFVEDSTSRNKRLVFAEQLGNLSLCWTLLQGKIDSLIHEMEHKRLDCKNREGRLQRLHSWISEQEEKMRVNEKPTGWTDIEQTLKNYEDEKKQNLKSAELLQLKSLHLLGKKDGQHPGDQAFTLQVESTIQQWQALKQQKCAVQAALVILKDQWIHFDTELRNAAVHTASICNKLECSKSRLFSLQQTKEHVKELEELQTGLQRSEEVWTKLSSLCSDLKGKIHPGAASLLRDRLGREKSRWKVAVQDVGAELQKAQKVLRLWQEYRLIYGDCTVCLSHQWQQYEGLLSPLATGENSTELLHCRLNAISVVENEMEAMQNSVAEVLVASKPLIAQTESQTTALIQSETRLLSRDVVCLGHALARRRVELQEELEEHVRFNTDLASLEQHLKSYENLITSTTANTERQKLSLLEQSGLTPDLGELNKRSLTLNLSNCMVKRLRVLNTQWVRVFSQATARHREMYSEELCAQSFQIKCQAWMDLLEKVESGLFNDISGNNSSIREQLTIHQKLKMEVMIGQQLLDAVVNEALSLLENGQIMDRRDLILKLTQLKEQWQGTLRRVQKRSRSLDQLTDKWRLYGVGMERLWKLLGNLEPILPPAGLPLCSLQQLQQSIQDYEQAEEQLSLHDELYSQTIQTGRQIFLVGDAQTQAKLSAELGALKEAWEQSHVLVEKRKSLTENIVQNWNTCEAGLAESALRLQEINVRLKQTPLDNLEILEKLFKEHEDSLELWAGGLRDLATMKADVSQYVLPTDALLLQGQVEELHSQWEELCLKVSQHKREIADRLNAWIIFNDKNKELCEWLAQMERKVNHSSEHLSVEEMVEKLKKDCMEEINLFSENKSHLKQLGEQLLLASDRAKEAEIHGALRDVNDRWQHLFDHIEARVNKLKETMVTVQQLDKNMSNLRAWLSRIEAELTKPVYYSICHGDEIQKRLAEQQELQRDIEQHTEGVASILTLCDVLLHDEDACSSDGENDSIQLTTRSLDQRWRNICSMSLERRMRIEETWRLWCKFQDDYSHFEDWLNLAERTAAEPNSSDVLYTVAKEELKRYEAFQREAHEKLTQLEIINNQYSRLARENRIDTSSKLRSMVHQGNQRWDSLQKRLLAILRRLRHFTAQREEFESTRESLLVWLTEMDLQLTNVEHFSESDIHQKLKQLNGLKKEITLNTNKIDALIVFGEGLIQRSSPLDAALIEDELEELHSYCQEVFSRVARFHQRLTSPRPLLLEEPELCGSESTTETEGSGLAEVTRDINQPPMCLLSPPLERSGRETPVSVDSIPLEWDHTGDLGGSSSHEEDEDTSFFSGLSGVEVTESPEAFVKSTLQVLTPTSVSGSDVAVVQNWSIQSVPEITSLKMNLPDTEKHSPVHASTPYKQDYVQLMSKCSDRIESVKKVSLILDEEEKQDDHGLTGLTIENKPSGVIERWELLRAQAVSEEQCSSKDPQKLTSDLHNITSWLGRVTPELERLQKAETSVSVQLMEAKVKQLKEMQKSFARYKTLMLSLNLGGRELESEASAEVQQLQDGLRNMNQGWTEACMGLEGWEDSLRNSLMACQEFHETLHSLLLWLAHAESRRYTVNILDPAVLPSALQEHRTVLMGLEEELKSRQMQVSSLQEIASELLPESETDDSFEAREKLHVTDIKLRLLLRQVKQDLRTVQERLESSDAMAVSTGQDPQSSSKELAAVAGAGSRSLGSSRVERRDPSPQRSFFSRVLRAAFPLHLLFLMLLVLACLVPLSEQDYSCTLSNNFARSFYPMLRYTNGPPPT